MASYDKYKKEVKKNNILKKVNKVGKKIDDAYMDALGSVPGVGNSLVKAEKTFRKVGKSAVKLPYNLVKKKIKR